MKPISLCGKNIFPILFIFSLCLCGVFASTAAAESPTGSPAAENPPISAPLVLKSDFFSVTLNPNGRVTSAVETASQTDWIAGKDADFFALIVMEKTGQAVIPEKIEWVGTAQNQLKVTFQNQAEIILNYESHKDFFTLELDSFKVPENVSNGKFYRLEFGRIILKPDYQKEDAFGFSSLILTIQTNVLEYPGKASRLGIRCYHQIGAEGAKAAFVGVPEKRMREVMKSVTESILAKSESDPEYWKIAPPVSRNGGGFAMDGKKNFGSYIITSKPIQAQEVAEWAEHLGKFGVNQIDFHQGGPFRTGDFKFNEKAYPNGVSDFRRMTDELKKHGMVAGLHTYAEFFLGSSSYISPVPHKDLDVIRSFTLAQDLDAEATEFSIAESTEEMSLICGYLIRNSLYLRVDSEIIQFTELTPNGFAKCKRGAFGTKPAAHAKGARVDHLTQFFNVYFAPNPKSELFLEIARKTAKTYDEGGFSMIYLDALDGTQSIIDDREVVWYYDALFVREILRNIKTEPPLLEYSTMHASLWAARSRMGAWDSPHRGYLHFFDLHFASNTQSASKRYLPGQVGWFAVCPSTNDAHRNFQNHTLYREHVDYLGSKALAHQMGLSYLDISLGNLLPAAKENGDRLKTYDLLRRQNYFSPEICERVKEPKKHFRLKESEGKFVLAPAEYSTFKPTNEFQNFKIQNPFQTQKPYLRIENLYAVEPYETSPNEEAEKRAVELIQFDENQKIESLTAKTIEDPFLDLREYPGLGMWIYGDGQGQIVNVCLEAPHFKLSGSADHYAKLDHTGWKYFEFAESQNGEYPGRWKKGHRGIYAEFRTKVHYQFISGIYVMVDGPTENLRFRTLKALPIRETELKNPTVSFGGQRIELKGSIPSGCFAEILPESDEILVKDPQGNVLGTLIPSQPIPALPTGESNIEIPFNASAPRTRWTVGIYE